MNASMRGGKGGAGRGTPLQVRGSLAERVVSLGFIHVRLQRIVDRPVAVLSAPDDSACTGKRPLGARRTMHVLHPAVGSPTTHLG